MNEGELRDRGDRRWVGWLCCAVGMEGSKGGFVAVKEMDRGLHRSHSPDHPQISQAQSRNELY